MKCPKCGNEMRVVRRRDDGKRFYYCGDCKIKKQIIESDSLEWKEYRAPSDTKVRRTIREKSPVRNTATFQETASVKTKTKKPIFKCWWFWVIIAVVVIGAVLGGGNDNASESQSGSRISSKIESIQVTENQSVQASETTEQTLTFVLNWNEAGEYGVEKTLNADTDQAYTFYEYHVPAGKYRITNNGSSAAQVTVTYDGYVTSDYQWEEYTGTGDISVVMNGESAEIYVTPDKYIKLSDNSSNLLFELIEKYVSPQEVIEGVIRDRIVAEYDNTDIDRITINEDMGTDETGDYIALVYLVWNVENSAKMTKEMLTLYSDDLAATVAKECENVQEIAVFWTIPYHNNANAKCSYERKGNGMYDMDIVWPSSFN